MVQRTPNPNDLEPGKITGRSDDMLIIRGVNVFPTQIEELILKMPKLAPHYQLIVTRDGHLDKLEVPVEVRHELSASLSEGDRQALGRELLHHIKTYVGVTTQVQIFEVDRIERTLVGKAKRVIDRRPKITHELPKGAI